MPQAWNLQNRAKQTKDLNTLVKETAMPKDPIEDDILIENINSILLSLLGILSLSVSMILLAHSATVAVYSQQLPTDFPERSIFSVVLFVIGFGSLHVFRKRRESRKRKQSALFFRTKVESNN